MADYEQHKRDHQRNRDKCFCGGLLFPGTTLLTGSNGSLMVYCSRCNCCGHEEIDGVVAQSALKALLSRKLWLYATTGGL